MLVRQLKLSRLNRWGTRVICCLASLITASSAADAWFFYFFDAGSK